ncbi:SDR family oxidoreductase [Rhodobacteraceae bacterium NNCM2]|nr:SDR family oxidoreductase [Coraliihabitans acroporae]
MLLQDKTAIITGAAGGLGYACAEAFLREGAKVIISDVTDEKGEAAAKALGPNCTYLHCDVTKKADVQALVDRAVELHGRLDIAVANAGIIYACDPLELEEADYERVMAVNMKGVVFTGQLAAKQMLKQEPDAHGSKGVVINMSSYQAEGVIPEIAPYVISKGGIKQWTKALGIRLAQEGVRVNAIGPGSIATEMFKTVSASPEKMHTIMSRTPIGRAGEPIEIGNAAVFLASYLSSYMVGETIYVDGGRLGLNYTVPVKE